VLEVELAVVEVVVLAVEVALVTGQLVIQIVLVEAEWEWILSSQVS